MFTIRLVESYQNNIIIPLVLSIPRSLGQLTYSSFSIEYRLNNQTRIILNHWCWLMIIMIRLHRSMRTIFCSMNDYLVLRLFPRNRGLDYHPISLFTDRWFHFHNYGMNPCPPNWWHPYAMFGSSTFLQQSIKPYHGGLSMDVRLIRLSISSNGLSQLDGWMMIHLVQYDPSLWCQNQIKLWTPNSLDDEDTVCWTCL